MTLNLYFLVEGKTEKYIYPLWLQELVPDLSQVNSYDEVRGNNYYLFSANGYPSILEEDLEAAVEEIKEMGNYDYLVVVLDADELSVEERIEEVHNAISEIGLDIHESKVAVIVQNRCFETWCLGNRVVFRRNYSQDFKDCVDFYNVKDQDPEQMGRDISVKTLTRIAPYHAHYLRKMLNERGLTYTKGRDNSVVGRKYYLEQIKKRAMGTDDLASFRSFLNFLEHIRKEIVVAQSL